ncbi:hypothetical protein J1N35_007913 [Gossypium stocksii]|uniref:DUF4283 domain-containing protein n=1 Tax=Gossypium stocksii TaxID=47602 RepID=A0A9D3WA28_9ROSI|nr:hypothetical protein J1N35_007913 [Gossypium stocksii]
MVRTWTRSFSTDQAYSNNLLVWVRLPELLEGMYTKSLLKFIDGVIGLVARIDQNTDNRAGGQFFRIQVFVDLDQPLVSKILTNGRIQRIENESLPVVCFDRGRYEHRREIYSYRSDKEKEPPMVEDPLPWNIIEISNYGEEGRYGLWMFVERKQRRGNRSASTNSVKVTMASGSKRFRCESLGENMGNNLRDFGQGINVGDMVQVDKV